ncbi:MAG: phage terminase large subunit family protein [Syntrophales bacterium LBB04]|nr:phage terminase large subunit family protein [Syntrophales bacterium LBB04]
MHAKPRLTVSQWADANRVLSPEASAEYGKWYTERAEYQRSIMDAFSDPFTEEVYVMGSAQFGKTEILLNVIGYYTDHEPAPMLVVHPTIDVGKTFSKDRLSTMLRDTPSLAGRVHDVKTRDGDNTTLHKRFPGGHITIAGANAPGGLRQRPIRIVLCDDVDSFPGSAGVEGDPANLAKKRTTTFWNRKFGLFSTPTIGGESRIELAYSQSDMRKYWVPCPHCGSSFVFRWNRDCRDRLRWPKNEPLRAVYHCPSCDHTITDAEKLRIVRRGEWRAEKPFEGKAGFWISELCSPWVTFGAHAKAYVDAKGDLQTMKVFVNTGQGETWDPVVISKNLEEILAARCSLPAQTVPNSAVALTCGIDHQKDGFWFTTWAWGLSSEGPRMGITGWLIHYGFLPTWADVEILLYESSYPTEDGSDRHRIWRAAVDTGGTKKTEDLSMTEDAYWWLVANMGRGVNLYGTKGASHPIPARFKAGEPLLTTPSGKPLPPWFHIILIDTDQIKDFFHRGIEQAVEGGSSALFLHAETDAVYAKHVLAERKVIDPKTAAITWQAKGANHLFDASLLAVSLAQPHWIGGGVNLIRGPIATLSKKPPKTKAPAKAQPIARSSWMNRK